MAMYVRIPHSSKNMCIDNATDTLSTTRLDGQIVIVHPLFASNHYYLVSRTDGTHTTENGKEATITAFLHMAECYSEDAYAMISERWV